MKSFITIFKREFKRIIKSKDLVIICFVAPFIYFFALTYIYDAKNPKNIKLSIVNKDNSVISSQYVLGTKESTHSFSFFGKILSVFQSKWGFLFLVVFPLFIAFLYEIYAIYREFKRK